MSTEMEDIVSSAVIQEELSYDFYKRLAGVVSHKETKDILEFLAKEELEHKVFLLSCSSPQGCKLVGEVQDTHLSEMLAAPPISGDISPKEALVIAMKREEASFHFYQTLADLQPPGDIQEVLKKMAKVELQHKEKVEDLYDNVAFPEVW